MFLELLSGFIIAVFAICLISSFLGFIGQFFRKEDWIWIANDGKLDFVKAKHQGRGMYYISKKDLKQEELPVLGWGHPNRVFFLGTTAFKGKSKAVKALATNFDREIIMWKNSFNKNIDSLRALEEKHGQDDVV